MSEKKKTSYDDGWWSTRALEDEVRELRDVLRRNARAHDRLWFDRDGNLWFTHDCLGTLTDQKLA